MIRRIIQIDKEKCNGCGICANACHEGAIAMVNGKAELIRDDYCDGLGDCLPACPAKAISFIEREAAAYDEQAVLENRKKAGTGCPGSKMMQFKRNASEQEPDQSFMTSQLRQWPVQIQLVPVVAPYFEQADLLVAADCSAYAYGNFHKEFLSGRIALVGCPKLDQVDYREKLGEIIKRNSINSITVVRMEVPCCGGLEYAVAEALKASGKEAAYEVITISTDGRILS